MAGGTVPEVAAGDLHRGGGEPRAEEAAVRAAADGHAAEEGPEGLHLGHQDSGAGH